MQPQPNPSSGRARGASLRSRLFLAALCAAALAALLTAGRPLPTARAAASCDTPSFKAATRFPAGKSPWGLAVTDLNGDSLSDVVVANKGANDGDDQGSVLVLLGDNGSLFKTGVSVKPIRNPRAVVPGDFNRDGKTDVAVMGLPLTNCCLQGSVTVLLGDGSGNLTETGNFSTVGANPSSMVGGDFNADGNQDVAVFALNSPKGGVYVLLGNGAGGFGAAAFYAVEGSNGQVTVGDFNGDGRLDLAAAEINGQGFSVLLGDGAGGFGTATKTSLTFNASSIVPGDFNRDGKLDIVAAGSNSVQFAAGDGTGKFNVGARLILIDTAQSVAAGDFNGDGKLDVAVTNQSSAISVLLGDGAGGFDAAGDFGAGSGPVRLVVGDFDRDNKSDLLVADVLSNDLAFMKGEGTGGFRATSVYAAGLIPFQASVGDFNGDGRPDFAVANIGQNHVSVMLGAGDGKFTPAPKVLVTDPAFVAVADFNGDAKQDLAVATGSPFFSIVSVALGDGAGGFGTPTAFDVGTNPRSIAVADFDNDGNVDMAVAASDSADISVLLGDGAGHFAAAIKTAVGGFPLSVITADFNRDCVADLVAVGTDNGPSVLLGDGTGHFSAATTLTPANSARSASAGDLDGDGNVDLVFATHDFFGGTAGAAVVFLGNGAGGFGAPTSYATGQNRELSALADFNGDGKPDIALLNSTGFVSVLLNAGNGTFPAAADFPVAGGTTFITAADFNGDGSPDIMTRAGTSTVSVLYNSCPGAASAGRTPSVQFAAPCVGVLESKGVVQVGVTRTGDLTAETTVDYFTSDGTASEVSDYATALGRLRFAPNEASKVLRIIITDDAFVESPETFHVSLTNPSGGTLGTPAGATVIIKDTDTSPGPNPITPESGNTSFFVRQHYVDFLNREPDADGLAFWTNEIEKCGTDQQCREVKRINVSAAFFLSIEFQETGYLVYRTYKAAYGDATSPGVPGTVPVVRFREFLADTQRIGQGVQVNVGDWQRQLEENKNAFALDFVGRQRFKDAFPDTLTAAEFVAKLDQNTGGALSADEKAQLVNLLTPSPSDAQARARVLRLAAEDDDLRRNEFNRAFVLMEYFGYLRRNPDDAPEPGRNFGGWRFWLDKLEQFHGNYIEAEMVKAFISSDEYKKRFGQ